MKRLKIEKEFLQALEKFENISAACEKIGISRQAVYRWKKEDEEFAKKIDLAMKLGTESINDLAKSKLVVAINKGEAWAIKHRLNNCDPQYQKVKYLEKIEPQQKPVGKITFEIVNAPQSPNSIIKRPKLDPLVKPDSDKLLS